MKADYKVLGDYIRLVDQRNRDLSVTNLLGVSIEKRFIPSIANIVGTDLSSYKIVRTGQFAYGPVTSRNGEKISIAYLDGDDCIISSSYTVFEVMKKDELDSEYLMLWFSRPEFDRYARYKSHGSVREIFDWNEMCMVELPVPAIEEQRKIVKAYKAITDRIALKKQINDNLDAQIQSIYKELFIDFNPFRDTISEDTKLPEGWSYKQIEECGFDISDGNYSSKYPKYDEFVSSGIPFIRGTDFVGKYISTKNVLYITPEMHADLKKGHTKQGDLLMSTRGEIGKIAFVPDNLVDVNINSQLVRINGNSILPRVYLAYTLLSETVKNEIKSLITGSVQEQLPIGKLQKIHILFPSKEIVEHFCKLAEPLLAAILQNEHEIVVLNNTSERILETLSRR